MQHIKTFAAVLTVIHVSAHDLGVTCQDIFNNPQVRRRHVCVVRGKIRRRKSAENIRQF